MYYKTVYLKNEIILRLIREKNDALIVIKFKNSFETYFS